MQLGRRAAGLFFLVPLALSSCTSAGRSPTFAYAKETEGGCADVFLHKGTQDKLEVLWISAEKTKLQLPDKGSKTFDLAGAPDGLRVAVDLWEAAPRFSAYCNDISPNTQRVTWKATKGKVTITLHGPAGDPKERPARYKASARLEGVTFVDGAGHSATLKEETITEVVVGWYAG